MKRKVASLHSAYRPAARFFTALVFMFCLSSAASAQEISELNMRNLQKMEDSLIISADSMFGALIPDTRVVLSERFARQLVRALKIPNSYYYKFDSLAKLVNIIYSDDGSFRIFNWEIIPNEITRRYYGAIQLPSESLKLYGLNDFSDQITKGAEDSILSGNKWFGAIYYRIMTVEVKGQKIHTLFGMNAGGALSTRKVLDPMVFTPNGVRFGAPIFAVASQNYPQRRINRFVLEYKKGVQASLNWDAEHNVIIFDKLVSLSNDPGRKYTYVPSGQYDGFRWANDSWNYLQDLIPVTNLKDGEAPDDQPR